MVVGKMNNSKKIPFKEDMIMAVIKKSLSIFLVVLTIFSLFTVPALASYKDAKTCITYNYQGKNAGKSSYITRYYTIKKNEKVKLQAYWNTEKLKNQTFAGLKLQNYLRFDVHIIDIETGAVVNYWYGLKAGDKFKVYSAVPKNNDKKFKVKVTSYLSNYKTYENSNLSGVAACLKYELVY